MTEGTGGHATLVKDTASGRVGVLPHILPATTPDKCGGANNLRGGCLLTGEYTTEIRDGDGASVSGATIQRGSTDMTLTVTIGGEGTITVDTEEKVTARFHMSGPGGSALPDVYDGMLFFNPVIEAWTGLSTNSVDVVRLTVPRATDGSGLLLDLDDADPCRASNQHRDQPTTVVIGIGTSTNTVPGFITDGPTATYRISCPPTASAARGVELAPDNRFPDNRELAP